MSTATLIQSSSKVSHRYNLRTRGEDGKVIILPDDESNDANDSLDDEYAIGEDSKANYEMLFDGWNTDLTEKEIEEFEPLIDRLKNKFVDFSKVLRANLLEKEKEEAIEDTVVIKQMVDGMDIGPAFFNLQNRLGRKIKIHEKYTKEQLLEYEQKEHALSQKIHQTELKFDILDLQIDDTIKAAILQKYHHLERLNVGEEEYAKQSEWIDYAMKLPWNKYTDLPVSSDSTPEEKSQFIKNLLERWDKKQGYVKTAKEEVALTLLDQLSTNNKASGTRPKILTLCGVPGTGKTLFMKSLADILGLGIHWIDFSGATDPSIIRGHHYTYQGAQPGRIIKGIIQIGALNGIIVLEEIDKIVQNLGNENKVENVLVSLLDRTRGDWIDDYLEFPFDISGYLFVATINDETLLSDPLRNRLHIIKFPDYKLDQKLHIAKAFEIPKALNLRGIKQDQIVVPDDTIHYIISKTKREGGVRHLKRAIESIIQRANFYLQLNGAKEHDVQFAIKDFKVPFIVRPKHVDRFLAHMEPQNEKWRSLFM